MTDDRVDPNPAGQIRDFNLGYEIFELLFANNRYRPDNGGYKIVYDICQLEDTRYIDFVLKNGKCNEYLLNNLWRFLLISTTNVQKKLLYFMGY